MGEGEHAAALATALRILTRRDHTEEELRTKLLRRGYSPATVGDVVNRLRELSYLDDQRVAASLATAALNQRGFFGPRLRMELVRRGVSRDLAAEVAADAVDGRDEGELLRQVLERKFRGFTAATASEAELRRVVGYLQRRGFSMSAIMQAVRGRDEF